jgi:hypothetical protein
MYPNEVIIDHAVKNGECEVRMGYASQREVNQKRDELLAAAMKVTEPLEIVTLPLGRSFGEVGLLVRKFKPTLGSCEEPDHFGLHVQLTTCKEWSRVGKV